MSELSILLKLVLRLPPEELDFGMPESERPTEMKLLSGIISTSQVQQWRDQGVTIRRGCHVRNRSPEIHFQVKNGTFHKLVIRIGSAGVTVLIDNQVVPIQTVEEFRQKIIEFATKENVD